MKRRHFKGMTWHVMARGARRLLLFRDDADRAAFLRLLAERLKDDEVTAHAFVLMDNHYHLLLTSDWDRLSDFMFQLNRRFSRGNNVKYGLKGHLFDGPYLSFPQKSPFWTGHTSRYIDFNPVRAGIVRQPELYRWSSCRSYVRGDASPVPLDKAPVLKAFDGSVQTYRSYEPPVREGKPSRDATAMDVWLQHIAWLLRYAEEHVRELEGEHPRTIAAAWARAAGVPPRAISRALGYASGHSVSVLLDTLRKRTQTEAGLRKVLSRADMIK